MHEDMWASCFHRCKHLPPTYIRQKFQNIFEGKLCNCFGSCYIFKRLLNMELSMMLVVLTDFAYVIDIHEVWCIF